MKPIVFLSVVLLVCTSSCWCNDLIVGTSLNVSLIWQQKVEFSANHFKKLVKEVFYYNSDQTIIKGIVAKDLDHAEASASLTAGGIGYSYVNIRLRSGRGKRINYQIEIYG